MMDFGYKRTRRLSTTDLPGVFVDPPFEIEILNSPSFELSKFVLDWSQAGQTDNALLSVIAENLIVAFINHDGERYPVEGPETIAAFVEATSWEMLQVLIRGWSGLVGSERMTNKKKLMKSQKLSNSTGSKKALKPSSRA